MDKVFPKLRRSVVVAALAATELVAQRPFQTRSPSSVNFSVKDGSQTVEISNVTYEVTSENVTGRPNQRLLLRQTQRSKQVLDEIGMEAETTLEAWPLGADLRQKPTYLVKTSGVGGSTLDGALYVANRQLEEVEWWSIYKLGTGEHLFDTFVPLTSVSISREELTLRYIGLEVAADDTSDRRLKEPNVIGLLTYASADRVKREALLTADNPQQVKLLRSYSDTTRAISVVEGSPLRIRVSFSQNFPSPPNPISFVIPIVRDDLDLAHTEIPPRLHVAATRR